MDSVGSGYSPVADSREHSNVFSGSIEGDKFLYQHSEYQLLKKETNYAKLFA
jgi:hypothetical protein